MAAEPVLTAADLQDDAAIAGPTEPARDSWTPLNLNTLPDEPPIRPTLGQTNLIYPGKRHVFSGPPESAKTLAAYCILIQTTRHDQQAVLIDFEMGPYDARQRLIELGATQDEIARILYLEPDQPATPERIATLVAHKPSLVVIDAAVGAYQLQGLDDNKRADVERFSQLYATIFWRNQIATILIDHVVKNAEERGRFQIGSERKLGAADVHLGFDTVKAISRGTAGRYKITTHKDRGGYLKRGHLADLHLDSDPETAHIAWRVTEAETLTGEGGYPRPTGYMERVSIDLETRLVEVSRNTVCDSIGGTKKYVLQAIDALVREGFVTETPGSNRSKLLASVRHYREKDPDCNPETTTGGAVVQEWFGSGSGTTYASGGSVVHPPYGGDTTRPPAPDYPGPAGWFDDDGSLANWQNDVAPDPGDDDA